MQRTLQRLREAKPVTIVIVGDSCSIETMLTQGRKIWSALLGEALWAQYGDGVVTMINQSRCGYSLTRTVDELDSVVLRWRPDLVITSVPIKTDEDAAALRQLVDAVRDYCEGEVLVNVPPPMVYRYGQDVPEPNQPGEPAIDGKYTSRANADRMVALAKELGCAYVDHFAAWQRKVYRFAHPGANPQGLCMRMFDPVHPNALGHMAVYRELSKVFGTPKYFPWEEVDV